ncbi:hypothetical protein CYMTET_47802 [Cymbomonas tetramitiformis]|uniref:Uncharacterized protein n=1 Tax=Cymbomonas tetramitiformis TaxID=36881 RepID=A0AAE0EW95_9CHLO|nr:hypothetical protein CYMTET_47802 [Cymbomonas tetramitiformis]
MASPPQRARMAAMQAAVTLLRLRHFSTGYDLVVPACTHAPHAKLRSNIFYIDNDTMDFASDIDFASPHSPLPPHPSLGRHLVVCGGVITTAHSHSNSPIFALAECDASVAHAHRILRLSPSRHLCADEFLSVVPDHLPLWPRTGVG